jgi:lipopolysaccharide heptosyltransferase II
MANKITASDLRELPARRICIIKPSALGDVVQSLPLLPILRERFPEAHVAWVINRELGSLLEGHPHLQEVIPFHRKGNWQDWLQLLRHLRHSRFDLVFDLQGLLRTGVMTWAPGAPVRVGLESAREGARFACNVTIPDSGRHVPAHLRYWRVAEALGRGERTSSTQVVISPADQQWLQRRFAGVRGPILAIQPGAHWETKCWPIEKFAVVACRAMRRYGFSVAVIGSPSEVPLAEQLTQMLRRFVPAGTVLNLAGETTLKQLAGLLSGVDLLLSNDSGPMHLAAGLGTPCVSVFTCTSPIRSGPPGSQHALVATELPCAASYKKKCPHSGPGHMACFEELSVERVWRALVQLVEGRREQSRSA